LLAAIESRASASVPVAYKVTPANVESHHNDQIRILDFLQRWRPRMLGDRYKMCGGIRGTKTKDPLRIYVNGQRVAWWDLQTYYASDIQEARYYDCNNAQSELRNILVIDLKSGVEP